MIVFTIIGVIMSICIAIGILHWCYVRIAEWFVETCQVPFSEENTKGTFKIIVTDDWDGFIKACLYELKKKWRWSKNKTWEMRTGGAAHYTNDSVERWISDWYKDHPGCRIENDSKVYTNAVWIENLKKRRDELSGKKEKFLGNASALRAELDKEAYSNEYTKNVLMAKVEWLCRQAQDFDSRVKRMDETINMFSA